MRKLLLCEVPRLSATASRARDIGLSSISRSSHYGDAGSSWTGPIVIFSPSISALSSAG